MSLLADIRKTLGILNRLVEGVPEAHRLIRLSTVLLILGTLAAVLAPVVGGLFFNALVDHWEGKSILTVATIEQMTGIMALLIVLWYVFVSIAGRRMLLVSRKTTADIRRRIERKLHALPVSYLDSHPAGELSSHITNDLDSVGRLLMGDLLNFISQQALVVMVLIIMAIQCPPIALTYIILVPLVWYATYYIDRRAAGDYAGQLTKMAELNGFLDDSVRNHALIKSFGMERRQISRFSAINDDYSEAYRRGKLMSGLVQPISILTMNVGYIVMAVLGSYLIIEGDLTLGTFATFLFFVRMINGPLTKGSYHMNMISEELHAVERIMALLDEEEIDESGCTGTLPDEVSGCLEFRDVHFSYVDGKEAIKGVSFTVPAGKVTAIVGPSGSGKTTLANMMMRFYTPSSGEILFDGKDISGITRRSLRDHMGMISQLPWVFDGTVAENIGYSKEGCTRSEIVEAARLSGFDRYVELLPDGYETTVGDDRYQLSLGEKKLLVLSRSILSDPDVLILDEATAGVDVRSAHMVMAKVRELFEGRTLVVITHSLYSIADADQIIYVEDGLVAESGTHEELMAKDGAYARMYRSQYRFGSWRTARGPW